MKSGVILNGMVAVSAMVAMTSLLTQAAQTGANAGTAGTQASAAAKPKRTSDGRPDLQGLWISGGYQIDGDAPPPARPPGALPPQPPAPPPYQPWAAEKMKQLAADRNLNDPAVRCLMLGVPRSQTWPFPFEIVQTPTKVVILYEAMRAYRIIPLDRKSPPEDIDPQFMGTSIGRWEGDTLVVDTIGFNDKTWISVPGSFHSEELHVTERFSLAPDNRLSYQAVVDDPRVLTGSWNAYSATYRHFPFDERIREYECNEDNQDVNLVGPGSKHE